MKRWTSLLVAQLAARLRAVKPVVSNRNLRDLESAWAAFNIAEFAFVIALGVLAFDRGGATAIGVMALLRTLPAIAAGPLLAVLTDRFPRQRMLTFSLAARAVASAGLFLAIDGASPMGLIYLLAAIDAAMATSFFPAQSALLPELSRSRDELAAANAVSSVVEQAGLLIGPLVTGIVLAVFDLATVFAIGGVMFTLGAVMAARISTDRTPTHRHRVKAELLDGWRVLRSNRGAALVVGLWTFQAILLGAIDVFTVIVAIDLLGLGESGVGFLGAVNGAGGVVGAIAMTTFSRGNPFGRYLGLGLVVMGAGLLMAGLWSGLLTVFIGFLLVGIAGGQIDIAAQTLLQRTVAEGHLGRVLGIFEGLYWGSLGVGGMLAGWLIVATSAGTAIVAGGAALVVVAATARGGLRRLDESIRVPDDRLEALSGNVLFSLLAVPTLEHMARHAETNEVESGGTIIRQDDAGDSIYVIEEGSVAIGVDGVHFADLGRHDIFGEIAPLRHLPRTASVTATAPTRLLVIDGAAFVAAVTAHTSSASTADAMVVGRLAGIGRIRRARGH